MKQYPEFAMRRAMKIVEVMLKAMAREIKWIQAADILGVTPRTIRRMRAVYQEQGIAGLGDRRRGRPSPERPTSWWKMSYVFTSINILILM